MTPQTVNAYYNPSMNEIVFPAAILQPPFFNPEADDAVNYGAIGAVIGHEISHGFDDQGARSDGEGNLRNWFTDEDLKEFKGRTDALAAQYSTYEPVPGPKINGRLTLGENIGDLSGLTIAYRAYQKSLGGKPAPVIAGFTGDQRFFLGFAQVWRTKTREEALRQQLLTDPHSPGQYRATVPLKNMPEFYAAFGVKQGDKMYLPPDQRVKVW
jgi:predicted metalloendopeptidase